MYGYAAYAVTTNASLPLSHAAAGLPIQTWLFALAASLNVVVGPFTIVVMGKCNGELERRSAAVRDGVDLQDGSDGETEAKMMTTAELVGWWGWLNAVRASIPMVGAVVALGALLM